MSQIRKGFIANNAIDGTKLKLLNNEAVRAANADGTDAELMKLDSSNVLQFLKLPQVSADPSAANDVARKSYVDSQVASATSDLQDAVDAEQAARELADAGLQSAIDTEVSDRQSAISSEATAREAADDNLQDQIDTEKGRIDAILSAATADADSFAEIVNLINSVDTTNDQAFASYVLSNDAALAQEVSDRQAGDSDFQDAIDAEASARASAVSSEASARQSADQTLQSNIDSEASARQAADSAEQSARQSADAALQAAIDALTVDDMTDVSTSSKTDGDLFQWDATEGKWKNVAPLSEAGQGSVVIPGTESVLQPSVNTAQGGGILRSADQETPWRRGVSFRVPASGTLSKIDFEMRWYESYRGTGQFRLKVMDANLTVLATSSYLQHTVLTTSYQYLSFVFANSGLTLNTGTTYYVEIDFDGTGFQVEVARSGSSYYSPSHWYSARNSGSLGGEDGFATNLAVYSIGESQTINSPTDGVIKTNASGMLDESFLEYDVNFGGHKLQGVSAPTSGTDAANKTYVDGEVASEASARASAISSEASSRQSADQTLQSNIDSEVSARQAAVSAEQSAREAGDASLQSQIDALDSGSSAGLAQEIADRTAADEDLQDAIDTEKARIDAILLASDADKDSFAEIVNLINSVDTENDAAFASYVLSNDAALAQEVSDRQSGDSTLQSNIDAEASARSAADSAETAAREAADTALQGEVDAVESALAQEVSDRTAAVSAEQSARETADQNLQDQIDALDSGSSAALAQEVSDRTAADAAEQAAREAADAVLQSNIDSETSARQMAISSEQSAREAADSALDTRVDALEAVTHQKAKFTITAMDIMNGYLELSHTVVENSELVFVGALYLHSGDHYTTSAGSSGTRITWAGDLSSMGTTPLVEGDVIYVRYQTSGAGGGITPPPPPGPASYYFPVVIGVTDNGDGTTNLNWAGASLPNAGIDMVYLVPATGPGMYDDSAKVGLGMGMAGSANVATPASGVYVLRVYDPTGLIAEVTSASFSI